MTRAPKGSASLAKTVGIPGTHPSKSKLSNTGVRSVREQRGTLEKRITEPRMPSGKENSTNNNNECLIAEETAIVVIIVIGMRRTTRIVLEGRVMGTLTFTSRTISMISGLEIIKNLMKRSLMNKNK
jgi:hypothetical protein